jgi:hypothetical protein
MSVTAEEAREFALAFDDASAAPHFDRTAFRTPRRIFATLARDGSNMNLMLDRDLQEFCCDQAPDAFAPVPGGWGLRGATRCLLRYADRRTFRLTAAHDRANSAPARRPRGRT